MYRVNFIFLKTSRSFGSVGPEWHKMRQSTAKHTLRPKTVAEYTGILNGVSDLFVNRLRFLRNNEGSVAQLSSELSKWALECKWLILYIYMGIWLVFGLYL